MQANTASKGNTRRVMGNVPSRFIGNKYALEVENTLASENGRGPHFSVQEDCQVRKRIESRQNTKAS